MRWSFFFSAVPLLQRPDEESGFGPAGHLISLLLQPSTVSPVFWQRGTESHSTSARTNTKAAGEKEEAHDSREKEKYRREVNKPSGEPAAVAAGLQSSI